MLLWSSFGGKWKENNLDFLQDIEKGECFVYIQLVLLALLRKLCQSVDTFSSCPSLMNGEFLAVPLKIGEI